MFCRFLFSYLMIVISRLLTCLIFNVLSAWLLSSITSELILFLARNLGWYARFRTRDAWGCVRSNLVSWPFDTPLLSPWCLLCRVRLFVGACVFRPCCGVFLFGCFLCPSHRPNLSRPLGGGRLRVGFGGLLGVLLFLPSLFLGVAWRMLELLAKYLLIVCFALATLLTFCSLLAM